MPRIVYETKRFSDKSMQVIVQANRILNEYQAQGFDLTLRQLYYQFVARDLIPNRQAEYKRLGSIVNDARMAGLIDWDSIIDRTRNLETLPSWGSPEAIIAGAARGYRTDKWASQHIRPEVWIEKDALVGVIQGVCNELQVPYFSCRGYTSQSEMWGAGQRLLAYLLDGQDVHVFHLGDHDPSGIDMTRDIDYRLFKFLALDLYRHPSSDFTDIDEAIEEVRKRFTLTRIALNDDQVRQYDPPPNPAKLTDVRAPGYIERFGLDSWELDALEPAVIAALIRDAVTAERDDDAWQDEVDAEEKERGLLIKTSDRWADVRDMLVGD